jgi:hypothetical protein
MDLNVSQSPEGSAADFHVEDGLDATLRI